MTEKYTGEISVQEERCVNCGKGEELYTKILSPVETDLEDETDLEPG